MYVLTMEDPSQCLSKGVGWVENARDVLQDNVALLFPFLNSEVLNGDVARARRWLGGIDHQDGGLIIFVQGSRAMLLEPEFHENGANIARARAICIGNMFALS